MPITKKQKVYKCELCNYNTTYRHLITQHLNRKTKCNIDNKSISISHTEKKETPNTNEGGQGGTPPNNKIVKIIKQIESDTEDEDEYDIKSTDTNDYMADILTEMSKLRHDDLAVIVKTYINDNLDDEEKTEFLEDLINND